ncbi:MAG: DUF1653 domain-containing protein [Mobilitalea sp.]
MDEKRMPKPGEIYNHFKDKPYQIITIATHTETGEIMVVYQALYGDFKTYVRTLEMFISEVDHVKYPEVIQKHRFELRRTTESVSATISSNEEAINKIEEPKKINLSETEVEISSISKALEAPEDSAEGTVANEELINSAPEGTVNALLLKFLDAESYSRKLDVITSNTKHLTDRLINDMAVSLDCTVDEGPLDERIHGLLYCLQAMCRFEDRRSR